MVRSGLGRAVNKEKHGEIANVLAPANRNRPRSSALYNFSRRYLQPHMITLAAMEINKLIRYIESGGVRKKHEIDLCNRRHDCDAGPALVRSEINVLPCDAALHGIVMPEGGRPARRCPRILGESTEWYLRRRYGRACAPIFQNPMCRRSPSSPAANNSEVIARWIAVIDVYSGRISGTDC